MTERWEELVDLLHDVFDPIRPLLGVMLAGTLVITGCAVVMLLAGGRLL